MAAADVADLPHPLVVARTVATEALAAEADVLNLSTGERGGDVDCLQHRGKVQPFVSRRDVAEDGPPLVECPLALASDVQGHVLISFAPVAGQTFGYPNHAFGEDVEDNIGTLADDVPHLLAPLVSLLDEGVGSHVDTQTIAARNLVVALTVALQRTAKTFQPHNLA